MSLTSYARARRLLAKIWSSLEVQKTLRLTILATIFLPLSLSAGILGMQSRFKNLGPLLYDFFGVVFILLTAVILTLLTIIFLGSVQEQTSRYLGERKVEFVYGFVWAITNLAVVVLGALVLSSFLVGMFKDVVLGAKILGFGFAAAIGVPLLLYFLLSIRHAIAQFYVWMRDTVISFNKSKENPVLNDVERNIDGAVKQKVESVTAMDGVVEQDVDTFNDPATLLAASKTLIAPDETSQKIAETVRAADGVGES